MAALRAGVLLTLGTALFVAAEFSLVDAGPPHGRAGRGRAGERGRGRVRWPPCAPCPPSSPVRRSGITADHAARRLPGRALASPAAATGRSRTIGLSEDVAGAGLRRARADPRDAVLDAARRAGAQEPRDLRADGDRTGGQRRRSGPSPR